MLGTRTIGRSLVFGLGYLAGSRAGRERYEQLSTAGRSFAGQLRKHLADAPDSSPGSVAGAARRAWDDSDITLGGT
jgi:hypothetical protein